MDLPSLITSLFLLLVSHFSNHVTGSKCSISTCGGDSGNPVIRFPFRLMGSEQPVICGSLGFDVICDYDSNQIFLELPNKVNLTIKNIDYAAQEIWVNDPNKCLPKILLNFNLSNSPFSGIYYQSYDFFNCSTTIKNDNNNNNSHILSPINCLGSTNNFVYATRSNGTVSLPKTCFVMAPMVKVPVQRPYDNVTFSSSIELNNDLRLSWFMPECQTCELNGRMCGLGTNSSGSQITLCLDIPKNNGEKVEKLPSTTVIAIILIICAPFIICIVTSFVIWIRTCYAQRSNRMLQNGPFVPQRPAHMMDLGLEEFNVEFARQMVFLGHRTEDGTEVHPNLVLSEIEDIGPGPTREGENNSCAICKGEYQGKDKIGNLPNCGHYFHADCINKWLLQSSGILGRTCPICRAHVE